MGTGNSPGKWSDTKPDRVQELFGQGFQEHGVTPRAVLCGARSWTQCESLSTQDILWFHDSVKAALAAASSWPELGLGCCGRFGVPLWVSAQVQEPVGCPEPSGTETYLNFESGWFVFSFGVAQQAPVVVVGATFPA